MTTTPNGTALARRIPEEMPLADLGAVLAKSGFFNDSRDAAQAIVKVLAGRELGFPAIAAMVGINIIKGKVSLSANLMAAAVKRSGRYDYRVRELTDTACAVEFLEGSESLGTSTFTMQDAQRAGIAGENYKKFPRNMLFSRAMSNGVKLFCPDVTGGPAYTPDELGAKVDGETGEMVTDGPLPNSAPPLREVVAQPAAPKADAPSPRDVAIQLIREWTGVKGEDLPAACRDCVRLAELPTDRELTDPERSTLAEWVRTRLELGETFTDLCAASPAPPVDAADTDLPAFHSGGPNARGRGAKKASTGAAMNAGRGG